MLRRLLSLLTVITLFLSLTACGETKEPFVQSQFQREISFQSNGTNIMGLLTYNSATDMTLKLSQPSNISGVEFQYNSQDKKVKSGDISVSPMNLNNESPVYLMFAALENLSLNEIMLQDKGEEKINLQSDVGEYTVTFNCDEKNITAIDIKGYHFIFE